MNKVEYVISVGAGKNQLPLIKRLVERGYKVISFDKNMNAPGKQISHIFGNISTWDYNKAIQWLESLNIEFKGVLCFSYGRALTTQQRIINHFNMNGKINEVFANIMIDKGFQRKLLEKLNLSTLLEYENYSSEISNYRTKNFIVKDKVGVSSNNIYIIKINEEHNSSIEKIDFSRYILQEYFEGTEYRIIGLIKNQSIKFISVLKRNNWEKTFLTGRLEPQNYYDKDIINLTEQMIKKFEIEDSAFKIDIIKNGSRIEILEIDFGIGGDYFETVIAPMCYNYNFLDNYINLMLGLFVEEKKVLNNKLFFDYIYNVNNSRNLIVDYDKICDTADRYFIEYKIIRIKEHYSISKYPQNNMDAVFAIIHNSKNLNNHDINMLFNQILVE